MHGMYIINKLLVRCHTSTLMVKRVCFCKVLAHFSALVSNLWIRGPYLPSFLHFFFVLTSFYLHIVFVELFVAFSLNQ